MRTQWHKKFARGDTLRHSYMIAALLLLPTQLLAANPTGHHDGANAAATWGWACQANQPTTKFTVVIKTMISGVLTQIGSVMANRQRQDASSSCGGNAFHGFIFTNYPQSIMDGASHDIYAYAKKSDGTLVQLGASPQNVSFAVTGLWDPGLLNGRWRTDFPSQTYGTNTNPLVLDSNQQQGCYLWTDPPNIVGAGPSYNANNPSCPDFSLNPPFSAANSTSSDGNFGGTNFWVITANSEYSWLSPYNSGPPNQTDPISVPGTGLMAVSALPDNEGGNPSRKKAHIIINKGLDPNHALNKIPFLSYGVQSDAGNGHGTITLLRQTGAPHLLSFALTLMDIFEPTSPDGSTRFNSGYVIIEALWGGIKRWAYISVLNRNNNNGGVVDFNEAHFNWNILQSVWFPGADIVFKNADVLDSECAARVTGWSAIGSPQSLMDPSVTYNQSPGPTRARYTYTIDLSKLFTCLSPDFTTTMPTSGNIPITAIHFAIEESPDNTGSPPYQNFTWIAVDSVTLQ